MTFRKGKKIKWKKSGKVETIERASNNRRTGNIVTDKREYSTDFSLSSA